MMRLTLIALLSLCLFCCGGDDEGSPKYSFKDQTLSGKIDNIGWIYGDGYSSIDGDYADITLVTDQIEDEGCNIWDIEGNYIFFYVPATVGVHPLKKLDLSGSLEDNQTVTLLVNEDIPVNIIAQKGAIEILTISETQITGRIDARFDDESFVNGNFTVTICQ